MTGFTLTSIWNWPTVGYGPMKEVRLDYPYHMIYSEGQFVELSTPGARLYCLDNDGAGTATMLLLVGEQPTSYWDGGTEAWVHEGLEFTVPYTSDPWTVVLAFDDDRPWDRSVWSAEVFIDGVSYGTRYTRAPDFQGWLVGQVTYVQWSPTNNPRVTDIAFSGWPNVPWIYSYRPRLQRPYGSNHVIMANRAQFLARDGGIYGTQSGLSCQVWRRMGPDDNWALCPAQPFLGQAAYLEIGGSYFFPVIYEDRGFLLIDGIYSSNGTNHPQWSNDLGVTWHTTAPPDGRRAIAGNVGVATSVGPSSTTIAPGIAVATRSQYAYDDGWGRDLQYLSVAWPGLGSALGLVTTTPRTAADGAARLWPFARVQPDGRIVVGGFVGDGIYRQWHWLGSSWELESDIAVGSQAALHATHWWFGRAGYIVACGCNRVSWTASPYMRVWVRNDVAADWRGPFLNVELTGGDMAPYVYQRPDGQWEAGWYTGTGWVLYRAADPAGTWTVVP